MDGEKAFGGAAECYTRAAYAPARAAYAPAQARGQFRQSICGRMSAVTSPVRGRFMPQVKMERNLRSISAGFNWRWEVICHVPPVIGSGN